MGMDGAEAVARRQRWNPASGMPAPTLPDGGSLVGGSSGTYSIESRARLADRREAVLRTVVRAGVVRCPAWPTHRCVGRRELRHDEYTCSRTVAGPSRPFWRPVERFHAQDRHRRLFLVVGQCTGVMAAAARARNCWAWTAVACCCRWKAKCCACGCSGATRSATSGNVPALDGAESRQRSAGTGPGRATLRLPRWLLLPAGSALRRRLPLPAAAAERLRDVVGFEIDRQTPFTVDAVAFDARVLGRRASEGQIDAELVAVPRTALRSAAGRARPAGADAGRHRRGGHATAFRCRSTCCRRRNGSSTRDPWQSWNLALAAVAIIALGLTLWQVLDNRREAADAFDARSRARPRPRAAPPPQQQELIDLIEGQAFLHRTRAARPTAVEIMDEFSRRLPDGTYLEKLAIEENRLTLIGLSNEAPALIGRLQDSKLWRSPALAGALQTDPTTRKDRFTLTAELGPQRHPQGGAACSRRCSNRDRWLALGLLAARVGARLCMLVHPWLTVPMQAVQRAHRRRARTRTAPAHADQAGAAWSAAPRTGARGSGAHARIPARKQRRNWPPRPGAATGNGGVAGQPGQPQLRDHQSFAAGRNRAREKLARVTVQVRLRCGTPELASVLHSLEGGTPRLFVGNLNVLGAARVLQCRARARTQRRAGRQFRPVRLPATGRHARRESSQCGTHGGDRCALTAPARAPGCWPRSPAGQWWPGCWRCSAWAARIAPLPEDASARAGIAGTAEAARRNGSGHSRSTARSVSRPLFADDRRPHPFSLQPQGESEVKTFDYVLTSVMITPAFKMAIIQSPDGSSAPLRIKLGEAHESLPNWRLQLLDARSAVFLGPEGERRLELRVFNGVGGEAPTPVTKVDGQRPAASAGCAADCAADRAAARHGTRSSPVPRGRRSSLPGSPGCHAVARRTQSADDGTGADGSHPQAHRGTPCPTAAGSPAAATKAAGQVESPA